MRNQWWVIVSWLVELSEQKTRSEELRVKVLCVRYNNILVMCWNTTDRLPRQSRVPPVRRAWFPNLSAWQAPYWFLPRIQSHITQRFAGTFLKGSELVLKALGACSDCSDTIKTLGIQKTIGYLSIITPSRTLYKSPACNIVSLLHYWSSAKD